MRLSFDENIRKESRKNAKKRAAFLRFANIHGSTLSSKEQWLLWWWQTSRNMILGHMPPWTTLWHPYWYSEACARSTRCTTLRPITKRNNIIGQQKRPRPETPRLDTNLQICQVIELHVEGKALEGIEKARLLAAQDSLSFSLSLSLRY